MGIYRSVRLSRFCGKSVMFLMTLFFVAALTAPQTWAATQTISGHPIQISVDDYGCPAIGVESAANLGTGNYTIQYFASLTAGEADWGSFIWLNGADPSSRYSMHIWNRDNLATPVSNTTTVDGLTSTITTVVDLGTSGIRVTQKMTYTDGDRFATKEWNLANTGETTYNDLRFFHGGDTYFGGEDSAYSFYDAANSMVYLRNSDYANWGIMGFYANPATPASHYFSGGYWIGLNYAAVTAILPDSVDASFQDAGYQLQWNRASLAPGETWTVIAYETWTPGGALQVIAPSNQSAAIGASSDLSFTVQNLSVEPVSTTLSAIDSSGWGAAVVGSTSVTIPANGSVSVIVRTPVPAGATDGQTSTVTLTANDGAPRTGSAIITAVSLNMTFNPEPVNFGTVAVGNSGSRTVTITNTNASSSLTLGTLGGSNPLTPPFSTSSDNCSGATLAPSATCTFVVGFDPGSDGTFNASLSVPITAPVLLSRSLAVTGTTQGTSVGNIEGRVTDTEGSGIQSVRVDVFDDSGILVSTAFTDAGGNYSATGFPSAGYRVKFNGCPAGYEMEWYTDKNNFASADPVSVTAPNATTGIDAVLPAYVITFTDIPSGFEGFVGQLVCNGITAGYTPTVYSPGDPITRAETAVFIEGALDVATAPPCAGTVFGDVTAASLGQTFCGYVEDFANRGITAGCGNGNFCPNAPVTRGQMAVFIERALGLSAAPPCTGTVFGDVTAQSLGETLCGYIEDFASRGITAGCGNGNFCPTAPVTRGQMAVFITEAFLN
jgi:hypothetical protein